ncbi:MAG: PEGA domain-containing protein [Deltaproteobacteria bacterium]|nr:PEGA domain-containing protein [Deltaproteobacteria bacterium]
MISRALSGSLLVLAVSLVSLVAASAEAQRPGTLIIEGDHAGAEVYIDAELVGSMPLEPLSLDPGNHTIRVVRPGHTEFTDVFRIRPDRETALVVDMMAISMGMTITTEPAGAQVFIDGDFAGETPLELDLDEGTHSLRLKLFGFHDAVREVEAVAGQDDTVDVALEALPAEELEELTAPPPLAWYEKPLLWVAIGGGVVLAVLTAVIIVVVTAERSNTPQADEFCLGMPGIGECDARRIIE